jgi:phosphate transport system protein
MSPRKFFDAEMQALYQEILKMGALVQEAWEKAAGALVNRDTGNAEAVIKNDKTINRLELEIEDRCTVFIATEHPVAGDLRSIITLLRIAAELERIADNAAYVAKGVIRLADSEFSEYIPVLKKMADEGISMLKESLTAFVNKDAEKALETAKRDDIIDHLYADIFTAVLSHMAENPSGVKAATTLLFISRYIERLGDHVTNICEWTVFSKTGEHPDLNE